MTALSGMPKCSTQMSAYLRRQVRTGAARQRGSWAGAGLGAMGQTSAHRVGNGRQVCLQPLQPPAREQSPPRHPVPDTAHLSNCLIVPREGLSVLEPKSHGATSQAIAPDSSHPRLPGLASWPVPISGLAHSSRLRWLAPIPPGLTRSMESLAPRLVAIARADNSRYLPSLSWLMKSVVLRLEMASSST